MLSNFDIFLTKEDSNDEPNISILYLLLNFRLLTNKAKFISFMISEK